MSRALMGIADRVVNEDGNNPSSSQTKIHVLKPEETVFDTLKTALSDLKTLQDNPSHIHKIEPDNLKTLCKLQLVDVAVSEKGKQTIQNFDAVENLAGELQTASPAIDSITKYRKEHKPTPG